MTMELILEAAGICPGCRRKKSEKPRYVLSKFNVFDCPACGLRFIDPSLTSDQQIAIYQNSEMLKAVNPALEQYYEYDVLRPETRTYQDYDGALREAGKLLSGRTLCEIGCGAGPFLKFARERGWQVTGLDSSAENIAALREAGMNAIHADVFKGQDLPRFDLVVLWDVIEHPQDPAALIECCKKLLLPDGILLIATPCYPNLLSILAGVFYGISGGKIKGAAEKMYMLEHTAYFSPANLNSFLSQCGFKTEKAWRTETDLNRYAFAPLTRLCLHVSFFLARLTGLQNRLISLSRMRA